MFYFFSEKKSHIVERFSKHGYAVEFSNRAIRSAYTEHHQVFLLDISCFNAKNILNEVSELTSQNLVPEYRLACNAKA